jgi:hypothetical protein
VPQTDRWDISYPSEDDQATGWLQMQDIAEDVERSLGKAFPVANEAARTAIGVAIGTGGKGFTVLQEDTGQPYMWLGAAWLALGGSGGGGGGSGALPSLGRWGGTAAQSIPNADDTIVSFPSELVATADIVRATAAPGHKFVLQRAGRLSGVLTLRYATTTASGVRDVHVLANGSTYIGSSGGAIPGQPRTHSVAIDPVDLASGTEITVECFQGTGSTRVLEPGTASRWVRLALELR